MGYYYYDVHFLGQGFVSDANASSSSYNLFTKISKNTDFVSWEMSNGMSSAKYDRNSKSITAVVSDPTDPYLKWSVDYSTGTYNALQITLSAENNQTVAVYLSRSEDAGYYHCITFDILGGVEKTYTVRVDSNENLANKTIDELRIDIGAKVGEEITISSMKAINVAGKPAPNVRLDRNYHVYGDKLHQQLRIVAASDLTGIRSFGTTTKIAKSKVSSLSIVDATGEHTQISGIDSASVEYVGFIIDGAGVFGYIFPPVDKGYTGSVTVTDDGTNYVVTQALTLNSTSMSIYDEYSIGHRIYTSAETNFDGLKKAAYVERNPLTNIEIVRKI